MNEYIKSNNIYLVFTLITLFHTNTTISMFQSKKTAPESTSNTEKIYKNSFHENMWGVYIQKKQPFKSFQIFANLTKTNKYAYKWMINFLHKTGNNQKIAALIPLIKSSFPEIIENDPDIGFIVAYALSASNPITAATNSNNQIAYNKDAMDISIALNKKFPSHQQVAALTATLYDLNNDPQNAIAVTEKYLNIATSRPTDFLEYYKNASRYLKLGDKKLALKNSKKCIELQPQFNNGWVILATTYDQLDKTQDAINACKKALELTGPNKALEYMLIRLFFKLKGAQHLVNEFAINKKCFENAIELLHKKEYDKALKLIDNCLAQKQKDTTINHKDSTGNINTSIKNNKNSELLKIKLIKNKTKVNKDTHKLCQK